MQIYKKGNTVDIKGMGTVQKEPEGSTMSASMPWASL
ncbi:rCG41534 [Rattus norvegicus]|uniref:RCG41534 n=1 Tax=Rattus norvegicus TaxID=10116 RepID=A6II22_RAT|nr:rCG41534 [Rattus norvegicus]